MIKERYISYVFRINIPTLPRLDLDLITNFERDRIYQANDLSVFDYYFLQLYFVLKFTRFKCLANM